MPDSVAQVSDRRSGRPSLGVGKSSNLVVRVPVALRARLDARAALDGVSVGATVRDAITSHLESSNVEK